MSESLQTPENLINEHWKETIRIGVQDVLDNTALAFSEFLTDDYPGSLIDFSPLSISNSSDEDSHDMRRIEDLSDGEREFIFTEVVSQLGLDLSANALYAYDFIDPTDNATQIHVKVYSLNRSDEGLFAHVIENKGYRELFVAPENFRI